MTAAAVTTRSRITALSRNPDFRLLWLAQASSQLGSSVSSLAIPLLAMALTGSALVAGLVGTVGYLAIWLAQLPAGYVADMFDRRRVMLWSDGIRAGLFGLFAVLVVTGSASVWMLLSVHVATVALWMVFNAALAQTIRLVVPRDQVPEAVGVSQVRSQAIGLVGPAIGGVVFTLGRAVPFLLDAVSLLVSWACVRRIRAPLRPESRPAVRQLLPDLGKGWVVLWRQAFLRSVTIYSVVTNVSVSTLTYLFIIRYAGDGVLLGLSMSVVAGAGMLGSVATPFLQRRLRLRSLMLIAAVVRGTMLVAAAWSGSTPMFVAAIATITLLGPVVRASIAAAKILKLPGDVMGRSSSAAAFVGSALLPLAPLIAGWLLHVNEPAVAQLVVATGFGLVALTAATLPGFDTRIDDPEESLAPAATRA